MKCLRNDQIHDYLLPASNSTVSEAANANSNDRNSHKLVTAPTAGTVGDERDKTALLLRLEVDLATAVAMYRDAAK